MKAGDVLETQLAVNKLKGNNSTLNFNLHDQLLRIDKIKKKIKIHNLRPLSTINLENNLA